MGLLIRLTIVPVVKGMVMVPVVKGMVMGRWNHYSKSRRREFTALTIVCWGESLRINLKVKEATFYIM